MQLEQLFSSQSRVVRFKTDPVSRKQMRHLLQVAADTPSFAGQSPIRLMVIEDASTQTVLHDICQKLQKHWFEESPEWILEAMRRSGETGVQTFLEDAPVVVCVFGELDKPDCRAAAWNAVERLRLAALSQGLQAQNVRLDSTSFLNSLLGVPQSFTPVAVVAVGHPAETIEPQNERNLSTLLLEYEPDPERLRHWNDPVRLGEIENLHHQIQRPFLSDKLLLLRIIQTAIDVYTSHDIDTIFTLVTRELRKLFRYDRASIAYLDPEDGKLRLRNVHKEHGIPLGENFVVPLDEDNVIGWVMLNKSGLSRNNIAKEALFEEQMSTEHLRSDMIVPLIADGTAFGTVNVGSYAPNAFTQNDFEILREFGKLVAIAVSRARGEESYDYDPLTGVLGHRRFHARLQEESNRCQEDNLPVSLLIIDLDHFRVLNESFGYDVGDKVLTSVAQVIRENTRDIDIVARLSGEQFAVILPEAGAASIRQVGERIRSAVEARVHALHHSKIAVTTTVSMGGALLSDKSVKTYLELIDHALIAVRHAKESGRNCVSIYDAKMELRAQVGS